jgi:hypothetical protein
MIQKRDYALVNHDSISNMLELSEYLRDIIYSDQTYDCIINQFGQKCHLVPQDKLARSHIGTKTLEQLAYNTLSNLKEEADELVNLIKKLNNFSAENISTTYSNFLKYKIVKKAYYGMNHVISFTMCIEECKGTYGKYTSEESGLKKETKKYLTDIGSYFFKIKSYINSSPGIN